MRINGKSNCGLGLMIVIAGIGLFLVGCKGADDAAPTNTKDSKYMDGGKTAADGIAAQRGPRRMKQPIGQ